MKMTKRITIFTVLFGGMIVLNSCLKNGKYYTDFSKNDASLELPLAASTNNGITAFAFTNPDTTIVLPIYVNVASTSPLNTAVTGVLAIDSVGLDAYDNANGTTFVVMPDSLYSLSGTDITIPAGQRMDSVTATIHLGKMDLSQAYVLAITIENASVPVEQWNHLFYYVSVKNKYDGHYQVTGTMVDAANSGLSGAYPMDVDLITSGANSVQMFDNAIGGVFHSITNAGSLSYYGSFGVQFNLDGSGSGAVISVVNVYGQPAANGRSAELDPSGINMWNESDKSMDVSYWMDQPTVITPHRTSFIEHFTYLGPR